MASAPTSFTVFIMPWMMHGRASEVPSRYSPSYRALALRDGNTKSRTKFSRRSTCTYSEAPVSRAFFSSPSSSSAWPTSAHQATTSASYVSFTQRRMTLVSNPPE